MSEAAARIERPVFIVGAPRSGTSLLFRTLMQAPHAFSIGGESHALIEGIEPLHPRSRGWHSNRLLAEDANGEVADQLHARFLAAMKDRDGRPPKGAARLVEKTPKNSLRVPFLKAAFPNATFVYLYRDPAETLASMLEAWHSGRFRTYPRMPDWPDGSWSLLLVPGWRNLRGLSLPEVVAHQWAITTGHLLDDLEQLPTASVHRVQYSDLIAAPQEVIPALCHALELGWDRPLAPTLPLSPSVVSAPAPGKWRREESAITAVLPIVEQQAARAHAFLAA